MKIRVQAKGSEFDFDCADGETLLYAGLRQGFALPYECATGTCGTCRARVMQGESKLDWDEAPGLSYVRRDKNELLMCRAHALGDCTLRVPATVGRMDSLVVPAYREGRLVNLRSLTHDVVAFEVDLDRPMSFHAGQFVVIEADEVVGGRAYSMVTFEPDASRLSFVVKRKPGGGFSDWLFDGQADGKTVSVYGPLGRATFSPEDGRNVLCVAGGSGIAGMMSIIDRGCQAGHFADHRGDVFFGVRRAEDVFFLDELSRFVESFPDGLEVTVALSDATVTNGLRERYPRIHFGEGFVHTVAAQHMSGRFESVAAYVAGPPPMVDQTLRMLILEARLPSSDIRYDKFS
jgi:toluene monooxygenase electron transfer component